MRAEPGGDLAPGPSLLRGDCLVVFDDESRLRWRREAGGSWVFAGVWPSPRQQRAIGQHLARGGRLLVLAAAAGASAAAYPEEIPARLTKYASPAGGEILEVRLDQLDWLPRPLRQRGEEFLRTERELPRARLLLPPVSPDPETFSRVRFARLSPDVSRSRVERFLDELLLALFPGAAPAPAPGRRR